MLKLSASGIQTEDFESGSGGWLHGKTETDSSGQWGTFLGRFATGEETSKGFSIDGSGSDVSFDFLRIDSWDNGGENGPEKLIIEANGETILEQVFLMPGNQPVLAPVNGSTNTSEGTFNWTITPITYHGTGNHLSQQLGLNDIEPGVFRNWDDQKFRIDISVPAGITDLELNLSSNLTSAATDESWGIDNFSISNVQSEAGAATIAADPATGTAFQWNFESGAAGDKAFNFLAKDQTLELTYTVQTEDSSGAANGTTDTSTVTVTITGSNDTPVITVDGGGDRGSVTEDSAVQAQNQLQASGIISFHDQDITELSDVSWEFISVVDDGGNDITAGLTPAELQAINSGFEISGAGVDAAANAGDINWTVNIDNALTQYLAAGEEVSFSYRIHVTDQSGVDPANPPNEINSTSQDVVITIHGANDAPQIRVGGIDDSDQADLVETDAGLTATGTLTASDIDLIDTATIAVTGVRTDGETTGLLPTPAELLSMLSVEPEAILNASQDSNSLTWSLDTGAEGFHYLLPGQTLNLIYELTITDGSGEQNTHEVAINVSGSNTGPYVTNAITNGEILEGADNLSASGFVEFTDYDANDTIGIISTTLKSVEAIEKSGAERQLTNELIEYFRDNLVTTEIQNTNNVIRLEWDYTASFDRIQFMGEGETITLIYTTVVEDQHGNNRSQDITVIIRGENNLPEILGGQQDDVQYERFNGVDQQISTSGDIFIKDLQLSTAEGITMIHEIEDVEIHSNINYIESLLPGELGNQADGYSGIQNMLGLSHLLDQSNVFNGDEANATLQWTFASGGQGNSAFEFLGDQDWLDLTYNVRIDNTGDAHDTATLELTGQYSQGDQYTLLINGVSHSYTVTANDLSANGDGTGNAATTEETQRNVAHNIADLVANQVNNGGVNTFNHGNAIEFRSDNKAKRLEIEVSKTPIGGSTDDGQSGDMVIDNGNNDGDNSHQHQLENVYESGDRHR